MHACNLRYSNSTTMVKTPSQARTDSEHDPENLPEVDGLEGTPDNTENSSSSFAPAAPQADRGRLKWQRKSQAYTIKALQEQLQNATDALKESQQTQVELNTIVQQLTPDRCETPGPHRLQPKGLRQEDKDFRDKVRQQPSDEPAPLNPTDPGLLFIKTQSLRLYPKTTITMLMNQLSSLAKTNTGTSFTTNSDPTLLPKNG
jgi:hypothetical protein